ncbi:conserved hypothetical protein [Histoplasma capsulatum H143]|uniref:Uncharacterized protein n=1 Tax=Ajellomyces capsulatus (strain H143) TaxID=544712 RepID=C6H8X5_AJECH|nr:conserved hypothetical protein [Histoplasma capsulatum H143]
MSSNFIKSDTSLSFFLSASTALILTLFIIYFFRRNQSPSTSSVMLLCTELNDTAQKRGCNNDGDALSGFIALNESATTELHTKLNWNQSANLNHGSNTPNTHQIQDAFVISAEIPVILRPLVSEVNTLLQKYGLVIHLTALTAECGSGKEQDQSVQVTGLVD